MKVVVKVEIGVEILVNNYKFVMTSVAFPEQYDVFRDGEQVGYVRLRGGLLRCHLGDCRGEAIYEWKFTDGKSFFANNEERLFFLRDIARSLEAHRIVEMPIECVNGVIMLRGTEYNLLEVVDWLMRLGKGQVTNNIMIDESETFSFCYGDKNDGHYIILDGNFVHGAPTKTFGVVDVEPLEDGGFVWRNFEDFDVEADFIME